MARKHKRKCEDCVARMPIDGEPGDIHPGRYRVQSNRWQCTPCFEHWLKHGDPATLEAPTPPVASPVKDDDDW